MRLVPRAPLGAGALFVQRPHTEGLLRAKQYEFHFVSKGLVLSGARGPKVWRAHPCPRPGQLCLRAGTLDRGTEERVATRTALLSPSADRNKAHSFFSVRSGVCLHLTGCGVTSNVINTLGVSLKTVQTRCRVGVVMISTPSRCLLFLCLRCAVRSGLCCFDGQKSWQF